MTKEVKPYNQLEWITDNLKIIDKEGNLVHLWPNNGQLILQKTIDRQRTAGYPVRIVLLKPRQVGWSTWCEAIGFFDINNRPNWSALCVSDDTDSTRMVFDRTKIFQAELPPRIRRKTDYSSRQEIVYAPPWRSSFLTQTAGKDTLGRGGTIQFFHASEVAFWQSAKEQLASVLQMLPNSPDTTVILESTANGMGGAFYEMFWQAVERWKNTHNLDVYLPVFFPWFQFPEYQTRCPKDMRLDDEEKELFVKFGLCNEQLWWRRKKIEELGGDVSLFRQEYPATAREAFQVSGRSVFSQVLLDKMAKKCFVGQFGLFDTVSNKVEWRPIDRQNECWQVADWPQLGYEYTHGTDVMEGVVSDKDDPKSKVDYHGSVIFCRDTGKIVAIYHGRCDPGELGDQCVLASRFYNMAYASPEVNDAGFVVLDRYKRAGYANIYQRQKHDERWVEEEAPELGWKTTILTRQWLVDALKQCMRDGSIEIPFIEIINEMRAFVMDKTGKPCHLPGEHDDLLFGLMIAIQLHLRCPFRPKPYPFATVMAGDVEKEKKRTIDDLAVTGAVDTWEPGDDEDKLNVDGEDQLYTV